MLSDPSFDVVFDDVILGENHALFDLTRIAQVLTELISEFGDPNFVNEAKLCEDLLNTIGKTLQRRNKLNKPQS